MQVYIVPILQSQERNFAYILREQGSATVALVDPAEPQPILQVCRHLGVTPNAILTTHQHWDHAGGNKELVQTLTERGVEGVQVFGGVGDGIPCVTQELADKDSFTLGDSCSIAVTALHTPCHTPGHLLFHCTVAGAAQQASAGSTSAAAAGGGAGSEGSSDGRSPFSISLTRDVAPGAGGSDVPFFLMDEEQVAARGIVFTGDTLFVGGCGRFNKGTPAQMYTALVEVIGAMPPDTLLAVGHEYTVANFAFGAAVEPGNADIAAKAAWAKEQVGAGVPTVPSTVAQELATNVFMRLQAPEVVAFAAKAGAQLPSDEVQAQVEVLHRLRKSKNAFRG